MNESIPVVFNILTHNYITYNPNYPVVPFRQKRKNFLNNISLEK